MNLFLRIALLVFILFFGCNKNKWYHGEWYNENAALRIDKNYVGVSIGPSYFNQDYSIVDGFLNTNNKKFAINKDGENNIKISNFSYKRYKGQSYSIKEAEALLNGTWDGQVLKVFFDMERQHLSMHGIGLFSSLSRETTYKIKDIIADWVVLRMDDENYEALRIKDKNNIILIGDTPDNLLLLSREK